MEKITKPVTNIEMLMTVCFCVAEWRWKREELYRPNAPSTALHQYGLTGQGQRSRRGKQMRATPGTIGAGSEQRLS